MGSIGVPRNAGGATNQLAMGGSISKSYLNLKTGLRLNLDTLGNHTWSSGQLVPTDPIKL